MTYLFSDEGVFSFFSCLGHAETSNENLASVNVFLGERRRMAVYCVCLYSISLWNCQFLFVLPNFFRNIKEFGTKRYFTDHQTANTVQLLVAIKGNFSGLFFWASRSEGYFPRGYLMNVYLLAIKTDITKWTKSVSSEQSL